MVLPVGAGCAGEPGQKAARPWSSGGGAVSRPVTGAGVVAVTGLRSDGRLETSVHDLADGRRLWARPATMVGRLTGMGVQPPSVTSAAGGGTVTALEPRRHGGRKAALVARDARTGAEKWARPVHSTFGPAGCGAYVCLSESTATRRARFVVLDPATGKALWRSPGIAEVQHADRSKVVLFRMSGRPSLEARDLRTGKALWDFPVERAVGRGAKLAGGWAFGALDAAHPRNGMMVGYMAPYRASDKEPATPHGFFAVRLSDGEQVWARRRMLRVYPSANPAIAPIARRVTAAGQGAFERIDPRTGRTTATLGAEKAPEPAWLLSFPSDLSKVGFVKQGKPGSAYDLRNGARLDGLRAWSFCTTRPAELKITGARGFYPVAALCAYDVRTGRKADSPGAPPAWYTGASDGWRVWRDERGALHGVRDAEGSAPGMYGL